MLLFLFRVDFNYSFKPLMMMMAFLILIIWTTSSLTGSLLLILDSALSGHFLGPESPSMLGLEWSVIRTSLVVTVQCSADQEVTTLTASSHATKMMALGSACWITSVLSASPFVSLLMMKLMASSPVTLWTALGSAGRGTQILRISAEKVSPHC